jgi:hypothetical protein
MLCDVFCCCWILGVLVVNIATATPIIEGLLDPDTQPKFVELVPEVLSPNFKMILPSTVIQIGVIQYST